MQTADRYRVSFEMEPVEGGVGISYEDVQELCASCGYKLVGPVTVRHLYDD